jgi:hypothetical protein
MGDNDVSLGEVNRNVQAMAGVVNELRDYVRAQNGRLGRLETQVAVLEAIGPTAPSKRGVVVVGLGGAGAGAAVTALLPFIKSGLGF